MKVLTLNTELDSFAVLNDWFIEWDGYAVPFSSIPCAKCGYRYYMNCPMRAWCNKYIREKKELNVYQPMTLEQINNSKGIKMWNVVYMKREEETKKDQMKSFKSRKINKF